MNRNWKEILAELISSILDSMEEQPEDPVEPEPDPEPAPEEPDVIFDFDDYVWEDSDSWPGQSYIMPPASLTSEIASINAGGKSFVYRKVWGNGRELWYGPSIDKFAGTVTITVKLRDGTILEDKVKIEESTGEKTEHGIFWGRYNGDRPTWYFKQRMDQYPSRFRLVIPGCANFYVTNVGARFESSGTVVKQSDVSGRGMAVVGPASHKGEECYIEY